jgi:SNF2 family DNA or RNA helicase
VAADTEATALELAAWRRLEPIWRRGRVVRYPHQIEAVQEIVGRLEGSALLADEVGLGKTVEAGLVLEELMARGRVARALILCPAALLLQWQEELRQKFARRAQIQPSAPPRQGIVLASLDWAKRDPQRRAYQAVDWDLVVVDEAHHLKSRRSQNHSFVAGLQRKHLVLITATPIQNELAELYNLVSLVKPDIFGSYMQFYRRFLLAPRRPRNVDELRQELSSVMVRRTRHEARIVLPPRRAELLLVELSPAERALYDAATDALIRAYRARRTTQDTILPLVLIQRELCSSSFALAETLRRMGDSWFGDAASDLLRRAEAIDSNQKAEAAAALLCGMKEPALVFTEYRATQEYLGRKLTRAGLRVQYLHGGQNRRERQAQIESFGAHGGALVATETGGQGLNLQMASVVVNYDLPWNPMRVEQRIGRAHRLGQTREVRILNLCARDTVEEHVLRLLHEKIDMFQRVIGDLDVIIRHLEHERPLEAQLFELFLTRDRSEIDRRLDEIALRVRPTAAQESLPPTL